MTGVFPLLLPLRVAKGPGSVRDGTKSGLCLPPAFALPRPPLNVTLCPLSLRVSGREEPVAAATRDTCTLYLGKSATVHVAAGWLVSFSQ